MGVYMALTQDKLRRSCSLEEKNMSPNAAVWLIYVVFLISFGH